MRKPGMNPPAFLILTDPALSFAYAVEVPAVSNDIKHFVAVYDITETFLLISQQPFFTNHFVVFDHKTIDARAAEATDEQVVLPFRDCISLIESHTAG